MNGVRRAIRDPLRVLRWRLRGRPVPPPGAYKRRLVSEVGRRFRLRTLVESGTAFGEMVEAQVGRFQRIESIELDPGLAARARERFAGEPSVEILEGDSGEVLPRLLEGNSERCLFWLDGHAMEGGVRGAELTPIRRELAAILAHPVEGHVVLVDDVRLFRAGTAYPPLAEIVHAIGRERPAAQVTERDDVLRVVL